MMYGHIVAFGVPHGYVRGTMPLTPMAVQVKMQSVGAGAYDQRVGRVVKARGLLEGQLKQRLVLLEGYSRISSMIEIEVEMNSAVRSSDSLFQTSLLLHLASTMMLSRFIVFESAAFVVSVCV
jgi:stage V sporulation protein SpoVS